MRTSSGQIGHHVSYCKDRPNDLKSQSSRYILSFLQNHIRSCEFTSADSSDNSSVRNDEWTSSGQKGQNVSYSMDHPSHICKVTAYDVFFYIISISISSGQIGQHRSQNVQDCIACAFFLHKFRSDFCRFPLHSVVKLKFCQLTPS